MKSEAVRIAHSQERIAIYDMVKDLLTNPVLDVVAGVIIIEYLQSHLESVRQTNGSYITRRVAGGGWMGQTVGTALETTLGAYLLLPQASKAAAELKPLVEAIAPLLEAGAKSIPLIAAGAG